MPKFITSGGMRIDYLITHEGEARVGMVGGNGLYAAVGAAIWRQDVGLWARIGVNYPEQWLQDLQQIGFTTEGLVRVDGHQEHRTFFAYTADGRRDDLNPKAHFAKIYHPFPPELEGYTHSALGQDEPHRFEPLAVRPEDWVAAYDGVTAVHLSPLSLATHLHVPAMLRKKSIQQISCDPGERYMVPARQPFIKQLLPQIDVFLPSNKEIRSLFGEHADLWAAAETLCDWGAPMVVIKNGAKGVLILEGSTGKRTTVPAFHKSPDPRVIDITGAGDSFCGGFMVGLAETGNPIQAARMGVVSSSLVIEGYGALYALGRREEGNGRLRHITPA
ncbi:MAG: carbohydrate kinase family protein [Chloroflexi bacterium]|nr:carbohydrate kinase family protein [Chloroflexota bacterium]